MRRRERRGGFGAEALATVALALVALAGLGCESVPDNELVPGHSGAEVQRLLVLPMNVFLSLPPDVDEGVDRVDRELVQYLLDHGKRVERVDFRSADRAWRKAARQAAREVEYADEEDSRFEAALAELAPMLSEQYAFDALLVPAVISRPAVLIGDMVRWDGVARRVTAPKMPKIPNSDVIWSAPYARRTEVPAPSLWLLVALPDGSKVFEGVGGLDVLIEGHWSPSSDGDEMPDYGYVPVEHPFQDRSALREGIALALHPYLPRLGARSQ